MIEWRLKNVKNGKEVKGAKDNSWHKKGHYLIRIGDEKR